MATTAEYLAQIARENEANLRAQAEGYESAAHKEAHANIKPGVAGIVGGAAEKERQANIRAAQVTDPRTGAPFGSASDMEAYANTQSQKVFNPVTGANFTSAVDYEIDANRRARRAGWLNAADLELYGPEGATRVDPLKFPFVDPRTLPAPIIPEQFRSKEYAEERGLEGHANILKYNPDQPDLPGYDPNWRDNYGKLDYHGNPIIDGSSTIGAGSMDLSSFRPWTQKYWDTYLPDKSNLLSMGKPQKEYGLSFLPGQFRDPRLWNAWEAKHMGHIPEGSWQTDRWPTSEQMGLGANTGAMQFTSRPLDTNIYTNPWSAAQMNLTPAQGAKWKGLLTGLDTAPAVDTSIASLLGVT